MQTNLYQFVGEPNANSYYPAWKNWSFIFEEKLFKNDYFNNNNKKITFNPVLQMHTITLSRKRRWKVLGFWKQRRGVYKSCVDAFGLCSHPQNTFGISSLRKKSQLWRLR